MKILRDTREQNPLQFTFAQIEIEDRKLDYGDYQIEGTSIIIERKASTGELYNNLITKDSVRFYKLVENLLLLDSYILCEFPESDLYEFPEHSGIPENKWKGLRASSAFLRKKVNELKDRGLRFVFCDDRYQAEKFIISLCQ